MLQWASGKKVFIISKWAHLNVIMKLCCLHKLSVWRMASFRGKVISKLLTMDIKKFQYWKLLKCTQIVHFSVPLLQPQMEQWNRNREPDPKFMYFEVKGLSFSFPGLPPSLKILFFFFCLFFCYFLGRSRVIWRFPG